MTDGGNTDRWLRWRVAFAAQARADLQAREVLLRESSLPSCQHLHFLQMACEKVAKAYLCGPQSDLDALQKSHAYIADVFPLMAKQALGRQPKQAQVQQKWIIKAIRRLARQVELLAPSVRAGGAQPANCEYPWEDARGIVHTPARHQFGIHLLYEKAGRKFLKMLYVAVDELAAEVA